MKTIIQINTTCNWGSTGHIVEQISLMAARDGWNCIIAHGSRYVNKSQFPTIPIGNRLDNYFHAFCGEFMGMHGLGSIYSTKQFIKKIDCIKPDLIHLHNIHGYYINYKVLFNYLAESQIPVVWTLHDCWSMTGHCTHFDMIGCNKWQTECGRCPLLMAQYKSRLFDRSKSNFLLKKRLYDELDKVTVVPVSNWLAGIVSRSILSKFPVRVIQNGIDISLFQPVQNTIRAKYSIPTDKMLILSVMNGYDKEKGIEEINKIAETNQYAVMVVGLSKNQTKGLSRNIINVGRTNNQAELASYYSAADVFLNPTYNDTFPTTNMEALACGTPVITYRTGGSPEIIDQKTGIVVEKGDYGDLLNAINTVFENGKEKYTNACRKRAVEKFNKSDRFVDYIKLYDEILNNQF